MFQPILIHFNRNESWSINFKRQKITAILPKVIGQTLKLMQMLISAKLLLKILQGGKAKWYWIFNRIWSNTGSPNNQHSRSYLQQFILGPQLNQYLKIRLVQTLRRFDKGKSCKSQ